VKGVRLNQRVLIEHLKNCYTSLRAAAEFVRSFFSRAHVIVKFGTLTVALALLLTLPVFVAASDLKTRYAELEALKANRTLSSAEKIARYALNEKDTNFRLAVLDDIAARGYPQVVPDLIPLLKDPAVVVRQRAARVIGMLGGKAAERALAKALARETNPDVKAAMLQGLSYCGSAESVPAIQATLKDSQTHVRANSINALDRIPGQAAEAALENAANDKDTHVRKLAQEARQRRVKPQSK
jgi:HEAT repeat protein